MADDLDDFLKQAALRRQQRQQQRTNSPSAQTNAPPPTRATPPTPRLQPQEPVPAAQVVEYSKPYEPTVGNLSSSLPSASIPGSVGQADERMQTHLKDVFKHEIGNIRTSETKPTSKKKNKKEQRLQETPAAPAEVQPSAKVSSAFLVAQLRDPQSLRMAIIAHEIMKRPWQ